MLGFFKRRKRIKLAFESFRRIVMQYELGSQDADKFRKALAFELRPLAREFEEHDVDLDDRDKVNVFLASIPRMIDSQPAKHIADWFEAKASIVAGNKEHFDAKTFLSAMFTVRSEIKDFENEVERAAQNRLGTLFSLYDKFIMVIGTHFEGHAELLFSEKPISVPDGIKATLEEYKNAH